MAPSASLYIACIRENWPTNPGILTVGSSLSNQSRHQWLPSLPGAELEARRVASLYPTARMLLGSQTTPDALAKTINGHLPGSSNFLARKSSDRLEGCRVLVSAILNDGVAAAALIDNCIHWVAITGVTFEGSLSDGIRLGGFVIDDPEDACLDCHNLPGISGITGFVIGCREGEPSAPVLDWANMEAWTMTHWRDGCNEVESDGMPRFATVAPARDISMIQVELVFQGLAEPISLEQASDFAERGIQFFGLDRSPSFISSLADSDWGRVARATESGSRPYYLVERQRRGKTTAIARVDSTTGEFLGIRKFLQPEANVFPDTALIDEGLRQQPQIVNERPIEIDPEAPLVWVPTPLSLHIALPFRSKMEKINCLLILRAGLLARLNLTDERRLEVSPSLLQGERISTPRSPAALSRQIAVCG